MKINEVERLVGVTKGNIRFYEKEGLLTPGRNSENGYRDYSDADVLWLKKVKLLRMLDVPIEEILRLREGTLTLSDAMERHRVQLERHQASLRTMLALCAQLQARQLPLDLLDADEVLAQMEQKEQEGTKFMDVTHSDRRRKYVGPVVAAAIMLVLMGGSIGMMVWALAADPEGAPPLWLTALLIAIPAAVILGVLLALYQRVKQIQGGEEDAAAQY